MAYFFDFKVVVISIIAYLILLLISIKKGKAEFGFIFFFTLLYIYFNIVIKYTQFPIYNDEFQREVLGPVTFGRDINLIPFKDALNMTSLLNIILTVPLGFLLPFIIKRSWTKILLSGVIFSLLMEIGQLVSGLWAGYTSRVIDINDVIFNTLGTLFGYVFFIVILRIAKILFENRSGKNKFLEYILQR